MSRRLAAIDVGTNSTRLIVADVEQGRIVSSHAREMVITRLGKGVDKAHRFDPGALERTLDVIGRYAEACGDLGVEGIRVAATSATRDASNRDEFLGSVRRLTGTEAEVLSGAEEAAASFLGATWDLPGSGRTLVFDIGGGSTEFIVGSGSTPDAAISLDIGSVRMTERHVSSDPPAEKEIEAVRADVRSHLEELEGKVDVDGVERRVGVAGTVTTVAAIAFGLSVYDPSRTHRAELSRDQIAAAADRLCGMTTAERAAIPVMPKGREDVIAAGAVLLVTILDTLRFPSILTSETDILDGLVLGLASRMDGEAQ